MSPASFSRRAPAGILAACWLAACSPPLVGQSADSTPGGHPSPREVSTGAFVSEHEVMLPGSPEEIYDAATGDISGWWDHSFSDSPARFFIEPAPGGCFCEIFDESGDGVRHATVTVADRGELLRFEGPLGLTGHALHMVHTYRFEAVGDSTRLAVSVHGAGELREGWAEAVDRVWHHFLIERFKPYVEEGGQVMRSDATRPD